MDKEYYMAVDATNREKIAEAINLLHGYVLAEKTKRSDPKSGQPMDEIADMMDSIANPLSQLQQAFSVNNFKVRDLNQVVKKARTDMANDIVKAIRENQNELSLINELHKTLEKYEIIGRDKQQDINSQEIPF